MIRKILAAASVAFVCCGAARAAPLEAYGKLPNIEQVELSPSGKLIAFIATDGDQRRIVLQTTAERKTVLVSNAGAIKVRDLTWAGDDHLLVTISSARAVIGLIGPRVERYLGEDINLKTGSIRGLMENVHVAGDSMNTIYGAPIVRTVGGRPVVFVEGVHFQGNEGSPALYRVDLDRDVATLVEAGFPGAIDWLVREDGSVAAEADYNDRTGAWVLRTRTGHGAWKTADSSKAFVGAPDIVGFTADGNGILLNYGDDTTGDSWTELSLETGQLGNAKANASDTEAIVEKSTGRVIGKHALVGDEEQYVFFDAHDAAVWRGIQKAFPGDLVTLATWSADRKKIVVRVDSAELGPAYSLVDLDKGTADWLGAEYANLVAADISARTPIRYKAADGLDLSGYLTLPRGRDPHGLPLIVLAHGGPARRDEPGFDWWSQALASRGYAVLQPNFRGSGGFGWSFEYAGFGQFGRKMQTDLSDGVRFLAAKGIIDPKRVCIVGGSYGGYAALAGVTLDTGVYRCAVDYAGMSDLAMDVLDSSDKGGRDSERYWLRFIGAKDVRDPALAAVSPAFFANRVDVPLLIIHGTDDTVVAYRQSQRMADALRRAGKPVEMVTLEGEDHWLTQGATRLQMLQASVAFLEKYNPPN